MTNREALDGLRVGLLGCGNMGGSVLRAIADELGGAAQLYVYDPAPDRALSLSTVTGATVMDSGTEVIAACDVVMLACKPQDAVAALGALEWPERDVGLISMLAGMQVAALASHVPETVRVTRVMPNVAALVGASVTGVLTTGDVELDGWTDALFETCGTVVRLAKEELFDALTGVSGSGPAYLFVAMEALADGGVRMGLPRDVALQLAIHTVRGAGELAAAGDVHPAVLKDRVASPGGTTIEALAVLEAAGFRSALIEAVTASCERSKELG
jgi:pyrroline-5-carboxylate reductase